MYDFWRGLVLCIYNYVYVILLYTFYIFIIIIYDWLVVWNFFSSIYWE